jgi:hypothetical protein
MSPAFIPEPPFRPWLGRAHGSGIHYFQHLEKPRAAALDAGAGVFGGRKQLLLRDLLFEGGNPSILLILQDRGAGTNPNQALLALAAARLAKLRAAPSSHHQVR